MPHDFSHGSSAGGTKNSQILGTGNEGVPGPSNTTHFPESLNEYQIIGSLHSSAFGAAIVIRAYRLSP